MMDKKTNRRQTIVLVHGLWMNPWFMKYLGQFFQAAGFQVEYFSYSTTRSSAESVQLKLQRFINSMPDDVVHIVAHSLGGLLTIKMLNNFPVKKAGRVVLLASPINGSKVATVMGCQPLLKWTLGESQPLLEAGASLNAECHREIGMLAGTVGAGLGRLITHLKKPCDGAVSEAETRAEWLKDHRSLSVSHSGMLFSSLVAAQVLTFIKNGRFSYRCG